MLAEKNPASGSPERLLLLPGPCFGDRRAAVSGLDLAGSAIPLAQLCGDYYDYNQLGPGRLLVTLGDVSGHGVGSALQMAEVRSSIRTLARLGCDPASIMAELNRMLCEDLTPSSFVSFFLAAIDVENRRLDYLGAGHDAFLVRASGTVVRLESTHLLLGIDPSLSFADVASTGIGRGDVFFLFTDGLNEARSVAEEEYGRQRPVEVVGCHRHEPSDNILQKLFQSVFEFTSGKNLTDDVTAIVVKVVR